MFHQNNQNKITKPKTKAMNQSFDKREYNENVDHTSSIIIMFNQMGYTNVKADYCLTNGLSIYVKLIVEVLNEGRCYNEMEIINNKANVTIRISDHESNLNRFGGVCGNNMTLYAFKKLVSTGAIKSTN